MLRVGPFIFSLTTAAYQNFTRSDNYRWQSVELIGSELAHQYMGPGERDIKLDGVVFTHWDAGRAPFQPQAVVGTEQINQLRSVADAGSPVSVTDGRGRSFGKFVITSLSNKESIFMDNGAAKKQEFDLTLRKYADGGSSSALGINPAAVFGGLVGGGAIKQLVASASSIANTTIGVSITPGASITAGISAAGVDLSVGVGPSIGIEARTPIGDLRVG